MVYLFHFERPLHEATWTGLATAYRSYLKCLTFSEVDSSASCVMHLPYDHADSVRGVQAENTGTDGGDTAAVANSSDREDEIESPAAGRWSSGSITFLSFYYVNTKKGKQRNPPGGAATAVSTPNLPYDNDRTVARRSVVVIVFLADRRLAVCLATTAPNPSASVRNRPDKRNIIVWPVCRVAICRHVVRTNDRTVESRCRLACVIYPRWRRKNTSAAF